MGVIWLYPVPILFDRFNSYVEPITTPYILPLTQMALTGIYIMVQLLCETHHHPLHTVLPPPHPDGTYRYLQYIMVQLLRETHHHPLHTTLF